MAEITARLTRNSIIDWNRPNVGRGAPRADLTTETLHCIADGQPRQKAIPAAQSRE